MKQLAVRPRIRSECPRLKRELLCRKGFAHPRQRIPRIGTDRRLLCGLRSSGEDKTGGKASESTHAYQYKASEGYSGHLPLPSQQASFPLRNHCTIPRKLSPKNTWLCPTTPAIDLA